MYDISSLVGATHVCIDGLPLLHIELLVKKVSSSGTNMHIMDACLLLGLLNNFSWADPSAKCLILLVYAC